MLLDSELVISLAYSEMGSPIAIAEAVELIALRPLALLFLIVFIGAIG